MEYFKKRPQKFDLNYNLKYNVAIIHLINWSVNKLGNTLNELRSQTFIQSASMPTSLSVIHSVSQSLRH